MFLKRQVDKLTKFFVACSRQSYKPYQIGLAVVLGSLLKLVIVPISLVIIGRWLDLVFSLGTLFSQQRMVAPTALAFCLGLVWMLWSIWMQHIYGQGTSFPLVPTKTLLVSGPYKYTRNPMAFGAIFWLLGWAFLANSPMALVGVVIFFTVIITYIKLVEEKELEERFGEEYLLYKQHTPFIIPRLITRR